jgi:hypothetical protein
VPTDDPYVALAFRDTPEADWSQVWGTDDAAVIDQGAATITVDVLRDLLADQDGAAPFPGRTLDGLHVVAQSLLSDADAEVFDVPVPLPQSVTDAMPDAEPYPALALALGLAQTGHARLTSKVPFRASNGEATTFVYNVTVENLADTADTFELVATSIPAGYTVVLPVPALALEPGMNATVPVLLTMPFGHQHGALASLVLESHSLSDPGSVGRVEIGVRFLAVPQPAGHHDTVYLHTGAVTGSSAVNSLFGGVPGYINTLEEDPADQGAKDCALGVSMEDPGRWHMSWPYILQPTLQMGMDVDAAKVGHFKIPVSTTAPGMEAELTANLYIEPPRGEDGRQERIHLAGLTSAPMDLPGSGATVLFEGDMLPDPAAPRVGFQEGYNLVLWITLIYTGPTTPGLADDGPCIEPGGSAVLPLREWHDAVDQVLASLDGPGLVPLGAQERLVNPGEAVLFPVSIANARDGSTRFDLQITGPNAPWATLSGSSISVPAHGTAQASVLVRAPADAADGERADLVLQVFEHDDPTARGLLRLVTVVDTDADQVDDSAAAPAPPKESPSVGSPVLLGLLALAVGLARRR